jgi:c-di-GMP-binding flagellar brake protein YcgR
LQVEVAEMDERKLSVEQLGGPFEGPHEEHHRERRLVAREGMVERRLHTRYAVDAWAEVLVKDGTMLFRGRVLDVSVGGCYIETEAKLKLAPGTPVEMVFRMNDDVFRCDAMSRMVRTKGAGFLFASLDARMQRELERLIQELERGD